MTSTTVSHDVLCGRCGKIAATFTIHAADEPAKQDRFVRTNWCGEMTMPMAWEQGAMVIEKLRAGGIRALQEKDFDTWAFYCARCEVPYCSDCWTWRTPEFDDGFYDCTRGDCPNNHRQILDD